MVDVRGRVRQHERFRTMIWLPLEALLFENVDALSSRKMVMAAI